MKACQAAVDSVEFSEWIAFWGMEAEANAQPGESTRTPTREELTAKIHAWRTKHNANQRKRS